MNWKHLRNFMIIFHVLFDWNPLPNLKPNPNHFQFSYSSDLFFWKLMDILRKLKEIKLGKILNGGMIWRPLRMKWVRRTEKKNSALNKTTDCAMRQGSTPRGWLRLSFRTFSLLFMELFFCACSKIVIVLPCGSYHFCCTFFDCISYLLPHSSRVSGNHLFL